MVPNRLVEFVIASPEHKSLYAEADVASAVDVPLLIAESRLVDELVH
jgi:hypothetical protein